MKMSGLSRSKAKEMLEHGEVHGKPLTKKQRGLFGAFAGGMKMKDLNRKQTVIAGTRG